jgi:hypothetical protein
LVFSSIDLLPLLVFSSMVPLFSFTIQVARSQLLNQKKKTKKTAPSLGLPSAWSIFSLARSSARSIFSSLAWSWSQSSSSLSISRALDHKNSNLFTNTVHTYYHQFWFTILSLLTSPVTMYLTNTWPYYHQVWLTVLSLLKQLPLLILTLFWPLQLHSHVHAPFSKLCDWLLY